MSISDTFTPVKPRSLLFTWKLIPHTAFITFHHIYNLSPQFRRKEKNVLCPQSECIAFGLIAEQLSWQTYRCTLYGPKTFRCVFRETNRKGNEIFQDWNELEQSAPGWSSPQLFSSRWHTHIFLFLLSEAKDIKMCTKTWLLLLSYLVSQDAFFQRQKMYQMCKKARFSLFLLLLLFQLPDPLHGLSLGRMFTSHMVLQAEPQVFFRSLFMSASMIYLYDI